jgi:hypothetical protein
MFVALNNRQNAIEEVKCQIDLLESLLTRL